MRTTKPKRGEIIEIGALLEDFNSKFDLVAEQTSQIPEIKSGINGLAEDMEIVKTDLEFIKGALKKKVDMDEFSALERRVISLESRLR
ncbi:MAG: hypothetical protein A2750_01985 [Candidatus Yanofskybacteria bacterium RIFCSPHIGHO2_01_FULL_45_42]|uniref:Uncharacterized protein n=3 Tax=Candidatus Yanofskyibacteriota TaxID=1752733 RepID=A0A1F8F767_9BACT|nr:MAG: hypothetical protein A2750_01985 [Candidatus Yanofskybacteria bacterium RIFCSPHIGHO2_01_FULL_45_42]OGN15581.1 MAG: hypothetical protein A3C81_00370 [Candidatus Yanofskybacteria bacterium RIFCSPHIGHO2_02_FULL_46_19]OGN27905.1 MAG: hypothetical protein A3B17_01885 [Candidatus Yanofskybacteria bacterium RIFCSPLOWO2_01_FULL_45_72]OGN32217.1 MAG: hypothetical protein A3J01_01360 [Candidatus Yanofskybacteria bacterium RIFCSPLOWO2_02_FULL_45_18]